MFSFIEAALIVCVYVHIEYVSFSGCEESLVSFKAFALPVILIYQQCLPFAGVDLLLLHGSLASWLL